MKTLFKSMLVATSVMSLVACGSGGGGSSSAVAPQIPPNPSSWYQIYGENGSALKLTNVALNNPTLKIGETLKVSMDVDVTTAYNGLESTFFGVFNTDASEINVLTNVPRFFNDSRYQYDKNLLTMFENTKPQTHLTHAVVHKELSITRKGVDEFESPTNWGNVWIFGGGVAPTPTLPFEYNIKDIKHPWYNNANGVTVPPQPAEKRHIDWSKPVEVRVYNCVNEVTEIPTIRDETGIFFDAKFIKPYCEITKIPISAN